jgi:hypothetical protein
MTNCVFTICAKNYIGLAKILEKSLKQYNPECQFLIFVVDEFDNSEDIKNLPSNVIIAKAVLNMDKSKWDSLSFKYNLTEFCTAIKPYCFLYLFENMQYNTFIYLDPDIYFFNSLAPVYDALSVHSIVLTPHILNIDIRDNGENTSDAILSTGIFNLGFLALKNDSYSKKMTFWWCHQLDDKCFIDNFDGYFTDQKWMNLMPIFFDENTLHIIKHKGLNVAPWNYYEREIIKQNNGVLGVKYRTDSFSNIEDLIFVHYSGYDYTALKGNIVIQNNILQLPDYDDIKQITEAYIAAIKEQKDVFDYFIRFSYSYNFFKNGVPIDKFHRRLYRGLMTKNKDIPNPFSTLGKNSFFYILKKTGMIFVGKSKVHVDKISHNNVDNIGKKIGFINCIFKMIFRMIGYRNYQLFLRFFPRFSRFESQIFLVNKRYSRNNLFFTLGDRLIIPPHNKLSEGRSEK